MRNARLAAALSPSRVALAAVLLAAVGLRAWFGLSDQGIYWPDEIYQSLEPAHRLVYGYGLIAWEFVDGARNWAFPGFVAGLLWVARLFGLSEPGGYLPFVRLAFIAIAAGTSYGIWRLARAYGASQPSALAGAAVFALAAPFVYFGHRAMSETASALPVVLGLALIVEAVSGGPRQARPEARRAPAESESRARWRLWIGASLLGLSVLLRLQNGVFCLGALGLLAGRRRWRAAGETFGVLVAWALLFGLLDAITWHQWFHSAFKYLQFNLVEGKAAQWGTAPFIWYLRVLWKAMPLVSLLLAAGALLSARRAPALLLTCVAFFLLHSYTPHKELRFLIPMMPVVCALAALGLEEVRGRTDASTAQLAAAGLVLAALWSGLRTGGLTFGDLGAYETLKPNQSAWNDFGDVNRLLLAAHAQKDLCGLKVEAVHQAWTGGLTYVHRNVPYYAHNGPPRGSGYFNYVVGWANDRSGQIVAREGRVALIRIADGCVPDPHYDSRLP